MPTITGRSNTGLLGAIFTTGLVTDVMAVSSRECAYGAMLAYPHLVADRANLLHLAHAFVAVLEEHRRLARETDPERRAGRDQVAGQQRRPLRSVGDDLVDVEDQVLRVRVLHLLAVQDGAHLEHVR